ncbi:DUF4153 domain-containing protein [Sphaerisporangium fuscum]|uniref:DUF4153 domain-containing protein n=1 Tax=Sphaerisporangium fuscum TaxID=2835868 RepID=UPI001BDCC749|nr:DUF4153 domain-containing protein [Sphaerisporangium fuscum]
MRPLDFLGRIKIKLGLVILLAVATAFAINEFGRSLGVVGVVRMSLAAVLSLGTVQLIGRGMTRPLREMAKAAQTIAKGRYGMRVRATSRDEVGELARAFNAMAADLGEVDRQRREFVANVSHELRTPIAGLQAVLENIVDGVSPPDPATMSTALARTERLGRVVAQLLDLSRLDSGARSIEPEPVALGPLCAQAVREAALARDDLTISAAVPPGLGVRADPALLGQVLANLLDNAVRHSPPGSLVVLSARPARAGVRLEVADQGPGIPAPERSRVFERFSRLDAARAADAGGAGLGLAIVKEIVELHGGSIAVADAPVGCRMAVDLPGRTPAVDDTEDEPSPAPEPAEEHTQETGHPEADDPAGVGGGYVPPPLLPRPDLPETPRWVPPLAAAVGVLAAVVLPFARPGLGGVLVTVAAGAAVLPWARHRITPWTAAFALLAYAMVAVAAFRDAGWLVMPMLLAAFAFAALAVSGAGRGWLGMAAGVLSVPLAVLPLPWFLAAPLKGRRQRLAPVVAGLGLAVILIMVFGVLLTEADAVFSAYADRALSAAVQNSSLPIRLVVFAVFTALVGAATLVALRPPVDPVPPDLRGRASGTLWIPPLLALDLLFASFVAVQITALFGGDRRVVETAGLTYAQYARSGFFELVTVSVFVLGIVALAAGVLAPKGRQRWLLGGLLGLLCALTLVILASALHRLGLYVDAYGLSRLRASVGAAILWLGAVFALVMVTGGLRLARRPSGPLPRMLVLVTGLSLVAFAVWNPDLRVAESAVGRGPGRLDAAYLSDLGAEAVPVVDRLPEPARSCLLSRMGIVGRLGVPDSWQGWNLARERARDVLRDRPLRERSQDRCEEIRSPGT